MFEEERMGSGGNEEGRSSVVEMSLWDFAVEPKSRRKQHARTRRRPPIGDLYYQYTPITTFSSFFSPLTPSHFFC